jgi:DNA recombination protein RmuC
MTNPMMIVLIALSTISIIVAVIVLLKRPVGGSDLSTPLQNLTQAIQQGQSQTAVMAEKLSRLEPVSEAITGLQVELRGVCERVSKVETNQNQVQQSVAALGHGVTQTGTVAQALVDATGAMREDLSRAKSDLTELHTHARARQELETRTAESIRRLESIIAGTQSKGSAGENIVEMVFSKLPLEWQARDFRVGDKAVEFGLRLPNNLVLPIDSKWAATNLIEQFVACDDPAEQLRLKGQIESAVLTRTKEVRKYIDPNVTVNFAIATVPDAIYDLCCGIQVEAFQLNVVLVSYSMLVPYLLMVFQTMLKTAQSIDMQKLDMCIQSAQDSVKSLQDELEGRFSRALTMLVNSRDDMGVHLSKASRALTTVQLCAAAPTVAALPDAALEQ